MSSGKKVALLILLGLKIAQSEKVSLTNCVANFS